MFVENIVFTITYVHVYYCNSILIAIFNKYTKTTSSRYVHVALTVLSLPILNRSKLLETKKNGEY